MSKLRVLSLFAGIGGFDLGLERTGGFKTVAFCEIDPFCRRVLAKHWPEVPCYDDVRTLTADRLTADGISVDVICGGFPCQDISFAGKGAGLNGARSGLWFEYARLVGELGPRFVLVENVGALLSRGLDAVLGTLASFGYDAEWHCIPAAYVGAPHRRDRVWVVAYPQSERSSEAGQDSKRPAQRSAGGSSLFPNALRGGQPGQGRPIDARDQTACRDWEIDRTFHDGGWSSEPDVGRVAYGVPFGVERLTALGNAVVPQIPELIGHAILSSMQKQEAAAA